MVYTKLAGYGALMKEHITSNKSNSLTIEEEYH
jgi:hypothetical protein